MGGFCAGQFRQRTDRSPDRHPSLPPSRFGPVVFVVKGSVMFPAAAALGWAVLVYIGIDFGFWGRVFDMSAGAERVWRASGEAILAATLLVFLFAYLNLNRWHVRYVHITFGWLAFLGALILLSLFDP